MSLSVKIKKCLGDFTLDVAFEAGQEIFAVLGESGCGKSMTLKCIAGIEQPDEGKIVLNGRVLYDSEQNINLPARKRKIGYLFQEYALFPNMTVEENIGIQVKKSERKKRVAEYIKMFFLEGLEKKYPHMLSGGQKQRTALARMMITEPDIVLLDEPFSAVDSYLKWKLEMQIMDLFEQYQKPMLFVSHNRDEVYRLCDKMGIIHEGKMEVTGEKKAIFKDPQTVSAAILTGCKNISGMVTEGKTIYLKEWGVKKTLYSAPPKEKISVGIRAHDVQVVKKDFADTICTVERVIESPFDMIYVLRTDEGEQCVRMEIPKGEQRIYREGERLFLAFPEESLLFLE